MPDKIQNYKLALQLFKTINDRTPSKDWIQLNNNIINTSRQTTFATKKKNILKVGMNQLSNRLWYLNGKIRLD